MTADSNKRDPGGLLSRAGALGRSLAGGFQWLRRTPLGKQREAFLGWLFPDRQLVLRTGGRISYVRFSRRSQIAIAGIISLAVGWTLYSTATYFLNGVILAAKDNEIANVRLAYRGLLGEVTGYQKKFTSITKDLDENYVLMLSLVEQNASLQKNLKTVKTQLATTEQQREMIIASRETLKGEVSGLESKLRSLSSRRLALKENVDTLESDLQAALTERNNAFFKGNQMRRKIKELGVRFTNLQENEQDAVQSLTESAQANIDNMEKVVKMAGLNITRLLKADGVIPRNQGGPFIEVKPDKLPGGELRASLANLELRLAHSQSLQGLMKKIPLTSPLNYYRINSSYGKRLDPINKKWSSHYGLDLGAPKNARIYNAAPGVVVYAGWKGKYGKFIEIDHGAGIKTRYGHLNKILVKKGQKIKFRTKIALVGNTGRSTGPHLHYEVLFKGRAKNPMKFIKAGRYVYKG